MHVEGNELIFSTGTRVFALRGVIGIPPVGSDEWVYGATGVNETTVGGHLYESADLTPAERVELAHEMIGRGQAYLAEAQAEEGM